ncbi:hypothetical protein IEQ34_018577 [Dendrobium chrysotoxum]|uniref:Uncharacterized protein n=1 Tax=Dendrobium chrysotoxum TaxID=161865 RepID=A0AAV7G7E7_DENCH|nr:hypothetical protein IEQ34_018577 [Dendrobium chrysotoxum]
MKSELFYSLSRSAAIKLLTTNLVKRAQERIQVVRMCFPVLVSGIYLPKSSMGYGKGLLDKQKLRIIRSLLVICETVKCEPKEMATGMKLRMEYPWTGQIHLDLSAVEIADYIFICISISSSQQQIIKDAPLELEAVKILRLPVNTNHYCCCDLFPS